MAFCYAYGSGFTCLEAGLVRTKNTATICLKNVGLYSLAGIMFYLVVTALCIMKLMDL